MAVSDYKTNPDENTTISGINIAEGCPPSGINNAIRQLMADVKQESEDQSKVMTGATDYSAGTSGNVPAPKAGEQDFFLRGDGSWAVAAGLPLGHFFTWPFQTPPDGSIVVNGATYDRTMYSDLWAYVSGHADWVKTESEWQSIASNNGGFCPYYSDGNGSTTFRVPKFAPYQQLAISAADAGEYRQAGLPTLEGDIEVLTHKSSPTMTGLFAPRSLALYSVAGTGQSPIYGVVTNLAAYRQSNVYGKSTTVQPESNKWIVCVVAYGRSTNVGNVDVANVMSAIGLVQSNKVLQSEDYIIDSWISGNNGYIKYANGIIDEFVAGTTDSSGAKVLTYPVPFIENPSIFVSAFRNDRSVVIQTTAMGKETVEFFSVDTTSHGPTNTNFYARIIGRWK